MNVSARNLAIIVLSAAALGGWAVGRAIHQARSVAALPVATVGVRQPYNPRQTQQLVTFWESRVPTDPIGGINFRELSAAYLSRYREDGDVGDARRAEAAARRSIAVMPRRNPAGYSALAHALMAEHRFHEALRATLVALADDPNENRLLADIYPELGDYAAASKAISGIQEFKSDPNYHALRARMLEVFGQQQAALALLQKAERLADDDKDMLPERVAWYHLRVGNCLAALGQTEAAEKSLLEAVQLFPRNYQAMGALARLAACRHDWASAIKWATQASAIVPAPDVLATLGDAYAATGKTRQAAQQYHLIEVIGSLSRSQGTVYDRQRAMYLADHNLHLPEALRLARREMTARRDIYTYDTSGWVCYRNGLLKEARIDSLKAIEHGTRDASLLFHAGVIANAAGQKTEAKKLLTEALAINPRFHPSQPQEARALLARLA